MSSATDRDLTLHQFLEEAARKGPLSKVLEREGRGLDAEAASLGRGVHCGRPHGPKGSCKAAKATCPTTQASTLSTFTTEALKEWEVKYNHRQEERHVSGTHNSYVL